MAASITSTQLRIERSESISLLRSLMPNFDRENEQNHLCGIAAWNLPACGFHF
jgi:hypothetical protein